MYFTKALISIAASFILTGQAADATNGGMKKEVKVGPARRQPLLVGLYQPKCRFLHVVENQWTLLHERLIDHLFCISDAKKKLFELCGICDGYNETEQGLLSLFIHASRYHPGKSLFPNPKIDSDLEHYNFSRHGFWMAAFSVFNSLRMNTPQELADYMYGQTKNHSSVGFKDETPGEILKTVKGYIGDEKNAETIITLFKNHIEKLKKTFDAPEKLMFKAFFDLQWKIYFSKIEVSLSYNSDQLSADESFFVDALGGEKFKALQAAIVDDHCKNIGEKGNQMVDYLKGSWEHGFKETADYANFDHTFQRYKVELNREVDECLKLARGDEEIEEVTTSRSTPSPDAEQESNKPVPTESPQSSKGVVGRNGVIVTGLILLTTLGVFLIIALAYWIC